MTYAFIQQNLWIFIILAIWEITWKGIALWKAARRRQLKWFVALLLINTLGVLSILYIVYFSKKAD